MRAFDDLTAEGQRRRLRLLAREAIGAYSVMPEGVGMRLIAQSFNTIFRVIEFRGNGAALRVGPMERIHADGTELVEARWMRELRADGAVLPPQVIDARDGTPVVCQTHPGVPGERICMLFDWVPGSSLVESMSLGWARQMGKLAALLHEHAADTSRSDAPSVLVADRVLYWRVEDRLSELPSSGSVIQEALDRAGRVLAKIWADPPHPPHLLHGDLTPYNLLLSKGTLIPIDFQDLVWGLEIQDLAISIGSLGRYQDAEQLREQFRLGYRAVRPWPDLDPETLAALVAARRLHQLNLALTLRRAGLDHYIARAQQAVAAWMSQ